MTDPIRVMKPKRLPQFRWIAGAAIVMTTALVFLIPRPAENSARRVVPLPSTAPGLANSTAIPPAPAPARQRQFAISLRSATHEWAEGDASSLAIIEKIAHNPDEFVRLVEENTRIKRRQLVYRNDTAAAVVQRARATGEPVRTLTLPGLDGQEITVEVTGADLAFSGLSGTFTGHIAGRPQSLVTLAFDKGREAFTVLSPEDAHFLQGHPREPGEVLVASFDPATYQPMQACNPILTNQ